MPERDAVTVNLSDGYLLMAAGIARAKNGDLTADLSLHNGKILFVDRTALNREETVATWTARATAPDRPTAERMADAIREYLYPEAIATLQEDPKKPTQADALVGMVASLLKDLAADVAEAVELFHDPDGDAFATIPVGDHRETWPLHSKAVRRWMARRFFEQTGKTPNAQSLIDATTVLAGKALFDGPEHPVFVRLAEHAGVLYLDLCDEQWRAIAVDATGWRVVDRPPVKFRRTRAMLPLPVPAAGGRLDRLRSFLNLGTDDDWRLVTGWLLGALRPRGPYPPLIAHGEQGSAKSTLGRVLRALLDPNGAPIRSLPRHERDLAIAASNSWCLCFDNASHLPPWLSDAYCRLATGGGFATRALYENNEETIFNSQRPIILNGIEELATRADLLDRAIVVYLPTIPEHKRQPEADFWAAFEDARPALLGALLDAASAALRHEATTRLDGYPRMADFARWVTSAEGALGWPRRAFLAAYRGNRRDANDLVLEASPVAPALRSFAGSLVDPWKGTATELLKELEPLTDEQTRRQKGWPANGRALSGVLRRLAPSLRLAGVVVGFEREGHDGKRVIRIERGRNAPSAASAPSAAAPECGFAADASAPAARDGASAAAFASASPPPAHLPWGGDSLDADAADGADANPPTCCVCGASLPPGRGYLCDGCAEGGVA